MKCFKMGEKKGNERSILKGFYMDYVNPSKTKYDFLFHNVFLQCIYNFET
jgi:hypothetical protein